MFDARVVIRRKLAYWPDLTSMFLLISLNIMSFCHIISRKLYSSMGTLELVFGACASRLGETMDIRNQKPDNSVFVSTNESYIK